MLALLLLLLPLAHLQSIEIVESLGLKNVPEDAHLTPEQLATKYGYPFEAHNVTTDDDYILTVFRIKHGKDASKPATKVVFLQHCLLCAAPAFQAAGPDKALAYRLADDGYDVWMGNSRGSYFSQGHVKYTTKDKEYWDFTWADMGKYDVPANIRYVKQATGASKIGYVGHSQGTI